MESRFAALIWDSASRVERMWLLGPVTAVVSGDRREEAERLSRRTWDSIPYDRRRALLENPWFADGMETILKRQLRGE
jgi:hypothetical protein